MKNVWVTSDTHFNHKSIVDYCHRPEDHEVLQAIDIERLNVDDILLHLGDFCLGNDIHYHKWLHSLQCKKWLVLGNHDKKSVHWYLSHGWDWVGRWFETEYMGKMIIFSHRPMKVSGEDIINIHGHLHNLERKILDSYPNEFLGQKEKHILVSPEINDYKLVKLTNLLENKIIKGERNVL